MAEQLMNKAGRFEGGKGTEGEMFSGCVRLAGSAMFFGSAKNRWARAGERNGIGFMNRSIVVLLLFVMAVLPMRAAAAGGGRISRRPAYLPETSAKTAYGDEWRDFKSTTKDLSKTLGGKNPEAASLLTQIQTNALFLETKWDVWFRAHGGSRQYASGDDYLHSLQRDNRLLNKIGKEKDE